jgi:hypothetical protein
MTSTLYHPALISDFGRKGVCILAMQGVYNEALMFSLVSLSI